MSQRTAKMASVIQQIIAAELLIRLGPDAALVTVTAVEVAPDLKTATGWIGLIPDDEAARQALFTQVLTHREELQAAVAKSLKAKFTPRLILKLDSSGAYAQHIDTLLRDL